MDGIDSMVMKNILGIYFGYSKKMNNNNSVFIILNDRDMVGEAC